MKLYYLVTLNHVSSDQAKSKIAYTK